MHTNLVDIYYMADEFCKKIETVIREHKLPTDADKRGASGHLPYQRVRLLPP